MVALVEATCFLDVPVEQIDILSIGTRGDLKTLSDSALHFILNRNRNALSDFERHCEPKINHFHRPPKHQEPPAGRS